MPPSSSGETGYLDGLLSEEKPPAQQPADDKPKAAESSPAPENPDEKPAPSSSADATAGDPAQVAKAAPKSALEAVKAMFEKDEAQEQPTGSKTERDKPADAPADADKAKAAADGDKLLPFHDHPRWKEVIAENRTLKEKAGHFDQFIGSVAQTGLNVGEFNELLGVGALIKHDPAKALERIEAVADQLRGIVGDKLPADLKKRVDDGEISEADARELSRAKARSQFVEQRQQQSQEERAQNAHRIHLENCDRASATWEQQQAASDPDWSKKIESVRREAKLIIVEHGLPPTVQDAVKVMNLAKKRVEEQARQWIPAKPKVEPPVKAGVASTSTAPAARTLKDAIANALALTRG